MRDLQTPTAIFQLFALVQQLPELIGVLREFNLIGANGGGKFPRHVKAEMHIDYPAEKLSGRILDLAEEHALEIRSAHDNFGQIVLAVIQGWGYRFNRLEIDGTFELEKNWT